MRKSKRIIATPIIVAIFAICALACLVFASLQPQVSAMASTNQLTLEDQYDANILKNARMPTLDENFEEDKVIIILKSAHSKISEIGFNDFPKITERITILFISDAENSISCYENKRLHLSKKKNQILTLGLGEKDKKAVLEAITELYALEMVLVAQPSYIYEVEAGWSPNDARYGEQWGLSGAQGAQVQAAWGVTRGNSDIRVGVMEAGFDVNHTDLRDNVITLSGGYIAPSGTDLNHGTHVAGIIGAAHNSFGVAGIAKVSLVQLDWKFNNFENTLLYAKNNNIKIINASFRFLTNGQPSNYDNFHYAAIQNYDGLFISCAHNQNEDLDATPMYPASYDLPNIVVVGATNESGSRWSGSNYSLSNTNVDIYAPGSSILSTLPNNKYGLMSGTSMAAPHVAGAAALVWSANPKFSALEVKAAILDNADTRTIRIKNPNWTVTQPTIPQDVKVLNAASAVRNVAFKTSNTGSNITGINFDPKDELEIPEEISGNTITSIGGSALSGKNNMTSVLIPGSISSLSSAAFSNCANLSELIVAEDNPIYRSEGNTVIRRSDNTLILGSKSGIIPSSVTNIAANAFYSCVGLTDLTIPAGVTDIANKAFNACNNLSGITVASGNPVFKSDGNAVIRKSDNSLVLGCKNTVVPSYVTGIYDYAFFGNGGLTSVEFEPGSQLTSIGISAFAGCSRLESITIPTSVEYIDRGAFLDCGSLREIHIERSSTDGSAIALGTFLNSIFDYTLESIIVPDFETAVEYRKDFYWYAFSIEYGVEEVPEIKIADAESDMSAWVLITDADYDFQGVRDIIDSYNYKAVYTNVAPDPYGIIQIIMDNQPCIGLVFYAPATDLLYFIGDPDFALFCAAYGVAAVIVDETNITFLESEYAIRDFYSLGYNIAAEYINELTEAGEISHPIELTDIGYFVFAPQWYADNEQFVLGLQDAFEFPVEIVYDIPYMFYCLDVLSARGFNRPLFIDAYWEELVCSINSNIIDFSGAFFFSRNTDYLTDIQYRSGSIFTYQIVDNIPLIRGLVPVCLGNYMGYEWLINVPDDWRADWLPEEFPPEWWSDEYGAPDWEAYWATYGSIPDWAEESWPHLPWYIIEQIAVRI